MRQSWDERGRGPERGTGRVRLGFARAVRQVLGSIVAASPPPRRAAYVPPASNLPAPVEQPLPDAEAARMRARAVLEEARAEMPTLLQDVRLPDVAELTQIPAEAAGLRQALRSYTDHVDRLLAAADAERRALREQVNRLSEELLVLRAEVSGLRALLPPPSPPAQHAESGSGVTPPLGLEVSRPQSDTPAVEVSPPEATPEPVAPPLVRRPVAPETVPVQEPASAPPGVAAPAATAAESSPPASPAVPGPKPAVAETHGPTAPATPSPGDEALQRFDARVFPAGTIGLLVALSPIDDFHRLTMVQERLGNEAGVESVELSSYESGEARLRLTFRSPARGRWLREVVERAASAPIDRRSLRFEQGVVHARLMVDS